MRKFVDGRTGKQSLIVYGMTNDETYTVKVVRRGEPPQPWQWIIYRGVDRHVVQESHIYYKIPERCEQAGKIALAKILNQLGGKGA